MGRETCRKWLAVALLSGSWVANLACVNLNGAQFACAPDAGCGQGEQCVDVICRAGAGDGGHGDASTPDAGPCASNTTQSCGDCGEGTRTCLTDHTWGECQNAGCARSTNRACGNCGFGVQQCGHDCAWGDCIVPEGVCSPDAQQDCGKCGKQTCLHTCAWNTCEEPPGACEPKTTQGCGIGSGVQFCLDTCVWGACLACVPTSTQPCDKCGTQTCNDDGNWGPCLGIGECSQGEVQPCGTCGTQSCNPVSCAWTTCQEVPPECSTTDIQICSGNVTIPGTCPQRSDKATSCEHIGCTGTQTCNGCAWSTGKFDLATCTSVHCL